MTVVWLTRLPRALVPGILAVQLLAGPGAIAAQPATPASYPGAPDPAACVVDARSIEEIVALLDVPVPSLAASPTPFALPSGTPADDATSRAVVATLHQVFACANAGDPLRFTSLFTDDYVRRFFAGVPLDDLTGFLSLPPQPMPEDQRRFIIRIDAVQRLPDGRAGVVIVLDEPDDPRTEESDYAILKLVEGRWLVDEIHEDGGASAPSPTP